MNFFKGDVVQATLDPFKDAQGDVTTVDGAPTWAGPDTVTIMPAADGMSAVITLGDHAGDAEITVTADVDRGEGVKPLVLRGTITVLPGEAVAGGLNFARATP
jgi:hypothetical protein